jgi:hypothetical protein
MYIVVCGTRNKVSFYPVFGRSCVLKPEPCPIASGRTEYSSFPAISHFVQAKMHKPGDIAGFINNHVQPNWPAI